MDTNPNNFSDPDNRAQRVLRALKQEYVVVGRTRVKTWHAWLVIGIAAGIAAGIIFIANRSGEVEQGRAATINTRPNILVVMDDDQRLDDQWALPRTNTLIGQQGATFKNFFVSFPVCCPSRSTFFTGQYAHNHGVLGNTPPQGGYAALDHSNTLPVWLQSAGYYTTHIGKYLNGYGENDAPTVKGSPPTEIPPGWTEWYATVGTSTYSMFDFTLNENGTITSYNQQSGANTSCDLHPEDNVCYQTDVLAKKAVDFIGRRAAATDGKPFFLNVDIVNPHKIGSDEDIMSKLFDNPPAPARYQGAFRDRPLQKLPSYNERDVSDKPLFIRLLPSITAPEEKFITDQYQSRLETLLAVDESVDRIVSALKETGLYDNTIILFTSDNGFFNGEHRLPAGKGLAYEEAIKMPLLISGPGIPKGVAIDKIAVNVDLAPTITDIAKAVAGRVMDGKSLLPLISNPSISWRKDFLVESPLDYSGVRSDQYLYLEYTASGWGKGAKELYDLKNDQYELVSQHKNPAFSSVMSQLKQRLDILKTCSGADCWQ